LKASGVDDAHIPANLLTIPKPDDVYAGTGPVSTPNNTRTSNTRSGTLNLKKI